MVDWEREIMCVLLAIFRYFGVVLERASFKDELVKARKHFSQVCQPKP